MILTRFGQAYDPNQVIDSLSAREVRAWLLELRTTLAPVSVAGCVRALKAFGNWLEAEGLADAGAFRSLRKPRVPVKLIELVPDDTLRKLLGPATVRDRAIVLLLLDTGLRVSESGRHPTLAIVALSFMASSALRRARSRPDPQEVADARPDRVPS